MNMALVMSRARSVGPGGYSSRGSPALSNRSISDGRFMYRVRSSRTRAVNTVVSSSRRAISCEVR